MTSKIQRVARDIPELREETSIKNTRTMLSLRRRHSRWRMFPILLFLGMICSGELAPIRVPEETLSASSSTTKKKDIGSLNEHWETWILVDSQGGFQPSMDSATLLRRITPKSVFIAPVLPACAEGYHADKMGRCVKSISINVTAHKDFIRERLKLMFGNPQTSKNDQKKSTGPLQLNIPLVPDVNSQLNSDFVRLEEIFSTNKPIAMQIRNETYFTGSEEKTKPHETSLYEVKNDTTLEEKSTFFLENSNSKDVGKIDRKPPATVSIAELIEEMNNTNLSEVVDYKVPMDNLKILLNSSSVKRINTSDGTEENIMITEKRKNFTETPAQVLASLSKLTNVDDLSLTQNDTAEQIAQMSNFTSNTTKESITVGIPDSTTLPTKQLTSISLDEQRDNETYAEDELEETSKPNDSQEADLVYDEEEDDMDYAYSTDMPDDEDSTEGEEILKHGEAGITIPTRNVERLDRDRHQRQRNQTEQKMLNLGDQVMIRFNDSAPAEDKDEAGSNISSEVSIDGDFILETTILDVNTERLQITTQSPDVTEKIIEEDDSKESFDKNPDIVPEVIFSQDVHGAGSTNSYVRERTEQLSTRIENERHEELEAAPSSESLLYDSPEDPITEIHMINEKRSSSKDSVRQESSKDFQSNVPVSSPKRTTVNLDSVVRFPDEDFVRFPDYVMPQRSSYVRFPSSEANSIHNPSYKQNSRYSTDVSPYGTSTKSSVPIRQKPVYYLTASSWKLDERQNRKPDLVHIWSKMPLIRDPDIPLIRDPSYQDNDQKQTTDNDQKQSHDRFFRTRLSRRTFAETSPRNRVPAQKRRTPIGG